MGAADIDDEIGRYIGIMLEDGMYYGEIKARLRAMGVVREGLGERVAFAHTKSLVFLDFLGSEF